MSIKATSRLNSADREFLEQLNKSASITSDSAQSERALMEMAYAVLTTKAAPLMRDPFRLGFEVIYTNEDNSRMVGIFVFRISRNIFYVPVFYQGGRLKGIHVIYDCQRKQCKPLTEDWCERLVSKSYKHTGRAIDRNESSRFQPSLAGLTSPAIGGGTIKVASIDSVLDGEPLDLQGMFSVMDSSYVPGSLFQMAVEKLGIPAVESLQKTCSAREDFLAGFVDITGLHDAADFQKFFAPAFAKQAAETQDPALEIIPRGHPDFVKHASEQSDLERELTRKRGWIVVDRRGIDKQASVASAPDCDSVSPDGQVTDILLADNETRKAALLFIGEDRLRRYTTSCDESPCTESCSDSVGIKRKYTVIVDLDNKTILTGGAGSYDPIPKIYALKTSGHSPISEYLTDKPQAGKRYFIIDKDSGIVYGCLRVFNKKDVKVDKGAAIFLFGDLSTGRYSIREENHVYHKENTGGDTPALLYNPQAESSYIDQGMLGKNIGFLEMAEVDVPGRSQKVTKTKIDHTLFYDPLSFRDEFIKTHKEDAAFYKVRQDPITSYIGVFRAKLISSDEPDCDGMSKAASFNYVGTPETVYAGTNCNAAAIALMLDSGLSLAVTEQLLKTASEARGSRGYSVLVKRAALTESPAMPAWIDGFDPGHGVAVQEIQKYVIPASSPEYVPQDILDHRLGDRMYTNDNGSPHLLTASPTELFEFANNNDIKSLFEHKAVSELIKTYDAGLLIDSFIPSLEEALDRLGRILILLYWKPSDIADIYGVDDASNLVDSILAGFLNLGEICLDLDTRVSDIDE